MKPVRLLIEVKDGSLAAVSCDSDAVPVRVFAVIQDEDMMEECEDMEVRPIAPSSLDKILKSKGIIEDETGGPV